MSDLYTSSLAAVRDRARGSVAWPTRDVPFVVRTARPERESKVLASVERIGSGGILAITHHADREDEGDLSIAASAVKPETLALFLGRAAGSIPAGIDSKRAAELDLPPMIASNGKAHVFCARRVYQLLAQGQSESGRRKIWRDQVSASRGTRAFE